MAFIITASFFGAALALLSAVSYYFTVIHNKAYNYELPKKSVRGYALFLALMTLYAASCFVVGGFMVYNWDSGPERTALASLIAFAGAMLLLAVWHYGRSARALTARRHEDMLEIVRTLEAKDVYTKGHSIHVYKLTGLIYEMLPRRIRNRIRKIKLMDAALFHDIGKIRIPLDIINKAGRLDDREYLIMTQHPRHGSDMLEGTQYGPICPYILYHHERPDGKGYYKLKGERIPLEARIIAVADTFSALYSERSYRKKMSYEEAVNVMDGVKGTQLDSTLVKLFLKAPKEQVDALS